MPADVVPASRFFEKYIGIADHEIGPENGGDKIEDPRQMYDLIDHWQEIMGIEFEVALYRQPRSILIFDGFETLEIVTGLRGGKDRYRKHEAVAFRNRCVALQCLGGDR